MQLSNVLSNKTLGSILLIAGNSIGAGMLALPVLVGVMGFIPATFTLIAVWLYMMYMAFLLLEANLWYKDKDVNLISLADNLLGRVGKAIVWYSYIFLFSCLILAYIVKSGSLIQQAIEFKFGISVPHLGITLLTLTSMLFIYFGVNQVDKFNKFCMLALVVTYFYLLTLIGQYSKLENLTHSNLDGFLFVIPLSLISFGFHNVIPTVTKYLEYDIQKAKKSILIGGLIPILIYIVWLGYTLSIIPIEGKYGIIESFLQDKLATEVLGVITGSKTLFLTASFFAFFATITSLLGTGLSMVDFLDDGLRLNSKYSRVICCLLTFIPAYIITLFNPKIFFLALDYAGGMATTLLFAIIPGLMVYYGRKKHKSQYKFIKSNAMVIGVILIGAFIFSIQVGKSLKILNVTPQIILNH